MPDVRNLAIAGTTVGANYEKFQINTSDAGKEVIIRIHRDGTDLTTANVLAAYRQLTQAAGPGTGVPVLVDANGADAGTFAAFGTADGTRVQDVAGTLREDTGNAVPANEDAITSVFVRLQTTGLPRIQDIVVAGDDIEFEVIAVFQPAK
jgi:hypothetical protein